MVGQRATCKQNLAAAAIGRGLTRRALVATGGASLAMPTIARASSRLLKIGFAFGLKSHLGVGSVAFGDAVERGTDGRYQIEQRPDGALGGELEMLEGVVNGEIDLALLTSAPFAKVMPDFGIFDVPFLFRDARHARAVLDGPIGQDYLAMFERKRVVGLAWAENGLRHITNALHPIHSPADLIGLHLRVPQSDVMMRAFQALGAEPEQLAFPDLYGALDTGRFDGQENPIAVIEAANFIRVQKHLSLTRHVYTSAVFILSQEVWDVLGSSDRMVFQQAALLGGGLTRAAAEEAELNGVGRLQQQGMNVVANVDHAAFAAALAGAKLEFEKMFGVDRLAQIRAVPSSYQ